ncbi:MAG TPA: protein kinase [Gemmatimonadales bacterium]|nr:protein kinase [Gemmatimonadales bacterium]
METLVDRLRAGLAGRYTIERELGRGGMATVYLAHDVKHDRPVALKVLRPELAATLGLERFQREIKLAARLQHPHILTVLDSGGAAGQLWYTMPFVAGESLRDRLTREKQLALDDALQIAREVADALGYAHGQGVIHRDIKPENILLSRRHALVADFGVARALQSAGGEKLTETGMAVGTPAYMSPEQATAERDLDARSDIYSLGCVLYEMLAGEPPYTGPSVQAVIAKRFSEPIPHLCTVRESIPAAIEQVVTKALARAPADRYVSAMDFAEALGGAGQVPTTGGIGGAHRFVSRRPLFTVLVVGFFLGAGALFAWRRTHTGGEGGGPKRLAVLPFDNVGDSADAYFADGLTDAVRGKLTALGGLEVIGSASSAQYRKSSKTPQQIGRELDVRYLLIGKVRWAKRVGAPSRVQVSPELIEAPSGVDKWQEPFDALLSDVFTVQGDIATRVARALDVALGTGARERLAERPTRNLAAYDAFLRGDAVLRGFANVYPASLRKALPQLERAVALDSAFVEAWGDLAITHAILYSGNTPTAGEAARRAAERALALAPNRPEGHEALALYYSLITGDKPRALAEARTALTLAPGSAIYLTLVGNAEEGVGRWEEGRAHLEQALRLDPLSGLAIRRLAVALLYTHHYPEARQVCDRGLALAPTNLALLTTRAFVALGLGDLAGARAGLAAAPKEVDTALVAYGAVPGPARRANEIMWALGDAQQALLLRLRPRAFDGDRAQWAIVFAQTYALRGDWARARVYADSARVAFEEQLRATPGNADLHASLGLALAYLGRKAEAIREGERAVASTPAFKDAFDGPYLQHQLARIYVLVGEPERALDQLEPLLRIPYWLSPGWLKIDPNFDPLRGNPRFQRLIAHQ